MPSNSGIALNLKLHPSYYFMGVLLLIHVAAMLCVLSLSLKWWADIAIAMVLFVSLIYHIEKYVKFGLKGSIRDISTENGKQWILQQKNGTIISTQLCADSVVTRYLLILNFKAHTKRYTCIIFKDALPKTLFQQLRVVCLTAKTSR